MRLQASKLDHLPFLLPKTAAAAVSSLLFEPSSRSLALMLADSSALLYPPLPLPLPLPSFPSKSPTVVPSIATAACFLRLLPSARILFLSTSPLAAGASVQLRAWTLSPNASAFAPARLNFKKQLGRYAVSLDIRHGFSVRIAGSVNVFVLHSLAESQIWVLAAKPVTGEDVGVELMKCAVVELTLPIYSITLTMGFLLLGESNGIRVFPLRALIKGGKVKKGTLAKNKVSSAIRLCKKSLPNGVVIPKSSVEKTCEPESGCSCSTLESCRELGVIERNADGCPAPCKLRTLRVKQISNEGFSFFVVIRNIEAQNSESGMDSLTPPKAVSIHLLSHKRFLVLDSAGHMHVFSLHNIAISLETNARHSIISKDVHQHHLYHTMEVQMVAVLPDNSAKTQVVWITDGSYSMHLMLVTDIESPVNKSENDERTVKEITISAIEAVFMSEKIQDIVPISANTVLVLCQGSIFLYAVA